MVLLNSSWVFFWCSGYTCINYHIRKCAQTMWTVFLSSDYSWFSHYIYSTYHIRKCAQTMQRIHQHCWQWSTSYISIFSDFFSDFLAIFTLITILGNAHRPCKLYLNIIHNSTSYLSFFSWIFLIFSLYLHYLPY